MQEEDGRGESGAAAWRLGSKVSGEGEFRLVMARQ